VLGDAGSHKNLGCERQNRREQAFNCEQRGASKGADAKHSDRSCLLTKSRCHCIDGNDRGLGEVETPVLILDWTAANLTLSFNLFDILVAAMISRKLCTTVSLSSVPLPGFGCRGAEKVNPYA
jgi:hypothetical protein